MIEGGRDDESVKAFIRPRNSLGDRSDKNKRMRLRRTEGINSRDERQIVSLKVNRHGDRATADIEHRAAQIGKAKSPKDHRARVVVDAQTRRGACLIGSLAGIEELPIYRK